MAAKNIPCRHDVTPSCTDSSYSKCPHCSLDLCLEHIIEHQLLVRIDFNEVIDEANQQKSTSSDHSAVNEMRAKALAELDAWKTTKIEAVMTVYHTEGIRVENTCDQCIDETSNVQNRIFEELSTASSAMEKKKNIHPRDIVQLKEKLKELNTAITKIKQNIDTNLTAIVAKIKLPEMIELEQRLEATQVSLAEMMREYRNEIEMKNRTIRTKDDELQRLQHMFSERNRQISNIRSGNLY